MVRRFLFGLLLMAGCATGAIIPPEETDGGDPVDAAPCTMKCNGNCTDLKTDNANCGKCGTPCAIGATCVQGSCQCGPNQSKCGATCVDLKTDITNCGKCGTICGNDAGQPMGGGMWACMGGACVVMCPAPKIDCGGTCVDVQSDIDNCGMCSTPCDPNTDTCLTGNCCKMGEVICGGKCTNTKSDAMNCGMCGKTCSGNTPVCANGACTACSLVGTLGNQNFCKVQINGVASDTNVRAACVAAGLNVGCQASGNCTYNDNLCVMTQEASCGNPMLTLAQKLGCGSPGNCNALNQVYQYMGQKWGGSACGVENGSWCSQGNQFSNRWALCVQ